MEVLQEREKTHGNFKANAKLWQHFHHTAVFGGCVEQQLCLTMIYLKLARAISNPSFKDHWLDIAGYATLAAEACEEK